MTQKDYRLIAVALLKALKDIEAVYLSDPDDLETMDKGVKIAQEAIAKAEPL